MQQSLSQKPLKKKNGKKSNTQPLSVRIQTSEKYKTPTFLCWKIDFLAWRSQFSGDVSSVKCVHGAVAAFTFCVCAHMHLLFVYPHEDTLAHWLACTSSAVFLICLPALPCYFFPPSGCFSTSGLSEHGRMWVRWKERVVQRYRQDLLRFPKFYTFKAFICPHTFSLTPTLSYIIFIIYQKTSLLAKSSRRTQMTSWSWFVAPSTAHCFKEATFKVEVALLGREAPQEVMESTKLESSPCFVRSASSSCVISHSAPPFRLMSLPCRFSPFICSSRLSSFVDMARTDVQYSSSSLKMSVSFTCPTSVPSHWFS